MVTLYCADGRIEGAEKMANMWLLPKDAESLKMAGIKRD